MTPSQRETDVRNSGREHDTHGGLCRSVAPWGVQGPESGVLTVSLSISP